MTGEKVVNSMEFREADGKMEKLIVSNLLESAFEPMKDREAAARFTSVGEDVQKLWVLDIDGSIAGTLSANPVKGKDGVWLLSNLSISPYWRKGGLARFMLDKCFEYLKESGAVVVVALLHPELAAAEQLFLGELEFAPIREEGSEGVYLASLRL